MPDIRCACKPTRLQATARLTRPLWSPEQRAAFAAHREFEMLTLLATADLKAACGLWLCLAAATAQAAAHKLLDEGGRWAWALPLPPLQRKLQRKLLDEGREGMRRDAEKQRS